MRTHDAIICSISKQFCIYGTRKLNDQVFAQPDFPFKFNAIFFNFFYLLKIRFSSDGNMTLTDFETTFRLTFAEKGSSSSWSYGSWIYNYLCNQFLSALTLWVRTTLRRGELNTTLCDKVCQWLVTGRWFSPGSPVSSTNKTDRHDLTEILLKVSINTINHHR